MEPGAEIRPFKNSRGLYVGVQCSATSHQTGKRCRRFTGHPFLTVCKWHGAAAPQVRRNADAKLKSLAPTAVDVLKDLLTGPNSREKFRAARLVLKLSGINASNLWKDDVEQLAIEGGTPTPTPRTIDHAEIEELVRSLSETQALEKRGQESDNLPPSPPPDA